MEGLPVGGVKIVNQDAIIKVGVGYSSPIIFLVALDGIFSNDFIDGLRKLHGLKLHMEDRGLLTATA